MTDGKSGWNPPAWRAYSECVGQCWRLTKGSRAFICDIYTHPLGGEPRCEIDGEMFGTRASRNLTDLLDASDEWKAAFSRRGGLMSKKRSSSSAKRTRKKPSSNTKIGHHYENVVRRIMKELEKRLRGQHDVEVSECRKLVAGHSGYSHRIDLSVRWQASLTLLECKCWKRGIDPGAVLCMFARVCDIQKAVAPGTTVSGAMVTKNRIGPGAATLAAAFGLKPYEVRNEREFGVEFAGDIHRRIKEERVRPKDSELYVKLQAADRNPQ